MDGMNWWMRLEGMTSGICDFPSSKKMFCMLMSLIGAVMAMRLVWQLFSLPFHLDQSTCQTNLLPSDSIIQVGGGVSRMCRFARMEASKKKHHFGSHGMNWYTFGSLPPPKSKVFILGRRCKLQFCRVKLTSIPQFWSTLRVQFGLEDLVGK